MNSNDAKDLNSDEVHAFSFERGLRAHLRRLEGLQKELWTLRRENEELKKSLKHYQDIYLKEDPAKMLKAALAGAELERRQREGKL